MSLTVAAKGVPAPPGDKYSYVLTVALDASYPNPAGYVITPALLGLNRLKKITNIEPTTLPAVGTWSYWIVPTFDADGYITSFAMHLAVVSTGVEVANAVNVSTASYLFTIEGN